MDQQHGVRFKHHLYHIENAGASLELHWLTIGVWASEMQMITLIPGLGHGWKQGFW